MGQIITCCVIINNMIVEDEYEAEGCDNEYLFEDEDEFQVDLVERTDLSDSHLFSAHLSKVRSKYMSQQKHFSLKEDLIEHLWELRGSRKRA